jgi:predicted transcriptional regulator
VISIKVKVIFYLGIYAFWQNHFMSFLSTGYLSLLMTSLLFLKSALWAGNSNQSEQNEESHCLSEIYYYDKTTAEKSVMKILDICGLLIRSRDLYLKPKSMYQDYKQMTQEELKDIFLEPNTKENQSAISRLCSKKSERKGQMKTVVLNSLKKSI